MSDFATTNIFFVENSSSKIIPTSEKNIYPNASNFVKKTVVPRNTETFHRTGVLCKKLKSRLINSVFRKFKTQKSTNK